MVARRLRLCPTCGARAWADATGCPFCKTDFRVLPPPCDGAEGTGRLCGLPAGHAGDHVAPPVVPKRWDRPVWGLFLLCGLLAAAAAVWVAATAVAALHGPHDRWYGTYLIAANAVLVPLSAILLAFGALGLLGPALERRRWLYVVVFGLVLVWAVAACYVPLAVESCSNPANPDASFPRCLPTRL